MQGKGKEHLWLQVPQAAGISHGIVNAEYRYLLASQCRIFPAFVVRSEEDTGEALRSWTMYLDSNYCRWRVTGGFMHTAVMLRRDADFSLAHPTVLWTTPNGRYISQSEVIDADRRQP